jgi:hypothetical protein
MEILGWIHFVLSLLAIGSGAIALRGVLRVALSCNRAVRFLEYSLVASLAGLLPITHHLSPIQGICMVSVYCVGVAVLAWRKFHLAGLWRPVFAFSIVAVLYLNVISASIRFFTYSAWFAMVSTESALRFEIAQFLFASVFAVLGVLAVRTCHAQRTL